MAVPKQTVLVLCHTIFHTAYRSESFLKKIGQIEYRKYIQSKFLLDFLILRSAKAREGKYFSATSQKVFDEFRTKIEKESKKPEVFEHIELLEYIIYRFLEEDVNKQGINEGIIVVADILCNRANLKPLVITDMKRTKEEKAKEFYKKYRGEDTVPFNILNLEEVFSYLNQEHPELSVLVKEKEPLYNTITKKI